MREVVRTSEDGSVQSPPEADTETRFKPQAKQVVDTSKNASPKAFDEALTVTRKGDWIIYYVGPSVGGIHRHNAMDASDAGLVALVQKRAQGRDFSYIAQRTAKKWRTK